MILPDRKCKFAAAGGLFADVIHRRFEHAAAALRTFAQRLLAGEIHLRRPPLRLGLVLAEIELGLELRRHLDHGGERPAQLAAKPLQRPDLPLVISSSTLGNLELPARHDFPQAKSHFWHWNFL